MGYLNRLVWVVRFLVVVAVVVRRDCLTWLIARGNLGGILFVEHIAVEIAYMDYWN